MEASVLAVRQLSDRALSAASPTWLTAIGKPRRPREQSGADCDNCGCKNSCRRRIEHRRCQFPLLVLRHLSHRRFSCDGHRIPPPRSASETRKVRAETSCGPEPYCRGSSSRIPKSRPPTTSAGNLPDSVPTLPTRGRSVLGRSQARVDRGSRPGLPWDHRRPS